MVADAGGEDAEFATFVEPAGDFEHLLTSSSAKRAEPNRQVAVDVGFTSRCACQPVVAHCSGCAPAIWRPFQLSSPLFGGQPQLSTWCRPAGLIVQNLIEEYLPESAPERASLLRRAKEMKLPENPLVRRSCLLNFRYCISKNTLSSAPELKGSI